MLCIRECSDETDPIARASRISSNPPKGLLMRHSQQRENLRIVSNRYSEEIAEKVRLCEYFLTNLAKLFSNEFYGEEDSSRHTANISKALRKVLSSYKSPTRVPQPISPDTFVKIVRDLRNNFKYISRKPDNNPQYWMNMSQETFDLYLHEILAKIEEHY